MTDAHHALATHEVVLPLETDVTPVADRHNLVYSGTLVPHGTGTGVVAATGAGTELGEIHRLVGTAARLATPLTRKIARFSKIRAIATVEAAATCSRSSAPRGASPGRRP